MYNRYLPPDTAFHPIPPEDDGRGECQPSRAVPPPRGGGQTGRGRPAGQPASQAGDLLGGLTGAVREALGGLFQGFSLEHLDSGDILLILIILFLFLEGDNLDLVVALGLMLLLGLGEMSGTDAQPSA